MTIRVLVADDQALVRAGFVALLDAQDGIAVIAEADTGAAAVAAARELRPDVVLIDIRMPEMDGLAATRAIVAEPAFARPVVPPERRPYPIGELLGRDVHPEEHHEVATSE